MNKKILIGVLVVAVVAAGLYFGGAQLLQGSLKNFPAYNKILTRKAITNVFASPAIINPAKGEVVIINYTVGKTLQNGLSVKIYKLVKNSEVIKTLYETNLVVSVGTQSITWDGKDSLGNLVPAGVYSYNFVVNGIKVAEGSVTVSY